MRILHVPAYKLIQPGITRALADGVELPLPIVSVYFAKYHSCHTRIIVCQVIFAHLIVISRIHKTDKCVLNHSKILASLYRLINGNYNHNPVIVLRHL